MNAAAGDTLAESNPLAGARIAVIGYGSQGHAHALNLQDAGANVVVGLRVGAPSAERAKREGLAVDTVGNAVRGADLVSILIPDQVQPTVFDHDILPNVKPDATILFAHGFNIHYGRITVPAPHDVILVAPKAPGAMMRQEFTLGRGVPALIAVHQDHSGRAKTTAEGYADAIGCGRAGTLETTFADETETDLFGEQAVLCGGVSALIKAGFETLVETGYSPELAYFECLHELKMIVDLIQARGLSGMRAEVSDTAEFGDYVAGTRVIGTETRQAMREVLSEIRSGTFAKQWIDDINKGGSRLESYRAAEQDHQVETVGRQLRVKMAWLGGNPS